MALLLDIETLADMVSIGTLLAFTIVCSAVLTIRYSSEKRPFQAVAFITAFIILISFAAFFAIFELHWIIVTITVILALIPGGLLFLQEPVDIPDTFTTPLVPFVPLVGITFNVFMMANLGYATWIRLVVWLVIGLLFYFLYGIRKSKLAEHTEKEQVNMEELEEIEDIQPAPKPKEKKKEVKKEKEEIEIEIEKENQ